jgi:hypothetical protein
MTRLRGNGTLKPLTSLPWSVREARERKRIARLLRGAGEAIRKADEVKPPLSPAAQVVIESILPAPYIPWWKRLLARLGFPWVSV